MSYSFTEVKPAATPTIACHAEKIGMGKMFRDLRGHLGLRVCGGILTFDNGDGQVPTVLENDSYRHTSRFTQVTPVNGDFQMKAILN